jgi:hypothetical protein
MSDFESANIFMTFGPTRKPMTSAMIASTIMISRMVMPPSTRRSLRLRRLRMSGVWVVVVVSMAVSF